MQYPVIQHCGHKNVRVKSCLDILERDESANKRGIRNKIAEWIEHFLEEQMGDQIIFVEFQNF